MNKLDKYFKNKPSHYKWALIASLPFYILILIVLVWVGGAFVLEWEADQVGASLAIFLFLPLALLNLILLFFSKSNSRRGKYFAISSIVVSLGVILLFT